MTTDTNADGVPNDRPDYRRLPPAVSLDEVIATVDPDLSPDPLAGRNADQHRALRDE